MIQEMYAEIQKQTDKHSVSELCSIYGVSRSGYYKWIKEEEETRIRLEEQDRRDFDLILIAYKLHGYTKGARGIQMALLHFETPVIMNLKKLLPKKYYRTK